MEVLLRPPVRRGLLWRVEGLERIPAEGPVLLASNHLSYFDPIAIANLTDLAGRRGRFLAKAELFRRRILGAALRNMGQLPVERGTGDAGALDAGVAEPGRLYPRPRMAAGGDVWWAGPPESARVRACRGRVAQAQLDAADGRVEEGRG